MLRNRAWVHERGADATLSTPKAVVHGIRYPNSEIVLCFKAKCDRPKDRVDLVRGVLALS